MSTPSPPPPPPLNVTRVHTDLFGSQGTVDLVSPQASLSLALGFTSGKDPLKHT